MDVIAFMVECAIRDRSTYIEAYCCPYDGQPISEEAISVIAETKAEIRDFRKLKKALLNVF